MSAPTGDGAAPDAATEETGVPQQEPTATTPATSGPVASRMDALDGLRTIAVFLVVFFHVAMPGLSSGFAGVDVFFVLSGYLITSGLVREVQRHGSIDLSRFWTRRLRRLMPAALLVLVAVLAWIWAVAPFYRRSTLGSDVFMTVVYLGNWHFMQAGSYFSADGTQSPLLHMWSLAVEEQFYIAWPLVLTGLLLLVRRMRRGHPNAPDAHSGSIGGGASTSSVARRAEPARPAGERWLELAIAAGLLLGVLSVVLLGVLHDPASPDRAYMGTDTKTFEPLLGALLALLLARPSATGWVQRHGRLLGWAGLVLAAGLLPLLPGPSRFYFDGGALLFSMGVAGVLLACVHTPQWCVARVLATGPMAWLGRISYGIYLWHWPLAVWLGTHATWRPGRATLVVLGSVLLAALSDRLVETPIRAGRLTGWFSVRRTLACAASAMLLVTLAASPLGGTPFSPVAKKLLPERKLDPNAILMVGDSVPQRMMPALAPAGQARGLLVAATTAGGCSPLGVHQLISPDDTTGTKCPAIREKQSEGIDNINPGTVVWWSRYEIADRYQGDRLLTAGTPEFWVAQMADFRDAVNRLTAHHATLVVILTESPGIGMKSRCQPTNCHPFLQRMVTQDDLRQHWNQLVQQEAARDHRIRTISLNDVFCPTPAHWVAGTWGSSLCNDTASPGRLRRPDGSHVDIPLVGTAVANALLDRVRQATGH